MQEVLHFTYKSIGNFARLLVTIQFEKQKSKRDISVFHQRFDNDESDELFEQFLMELYPEGATIGEQHINQLVEYVSRFMKKDEKSRDLFVEYDKMHYCSYVYFKPDKMVIPAEFGEHSQIVQNICLDYFKDFQSIDIDYLKKFIKDNFEISSAFTDIETVIRDARYIKRLIDKY